VLDLNRLGVAVVRLEAFLGTSLHPLNEIDSRGHEIFVRQDYRHTGENIAGGPIGYIGRCHAHELGRIYMEPKGRPSANAVYCDAIDKVR
jgi:hypothetical protein